MVGGGPRPRRVVKRSRMSVRQGNDLLKRPRGERRRHHEKVGALREHRNTGEIAQRVRRILVQGQVDRERRAVEKKGVAVGRGLGDVLVGDIGAGAGLVLDDHLLAEEPGEHGGEEPGIDVDASSRRETDHQPHRPGRERLARREAGVEDEQREKESFQPANPNPRASHYTGAMEAIEIQTGSKPAASIIWLHGLGADGHDFEAIVPELKLAKPVRFVFPHAPVRPVTINQGMRMRAWYDIFQFGGGPEDEAGIRASQRMMEQLIKQQPVPVNRVVMAGFSQGGAIALQAALRYPERLAGVLALSTYLPLAGSLQSERSPANQGIPIFMAHGSYDDIIPLRRAEESRKLLEAAGYPVEWHEYPMPHSVCAEEIADMAAFLARIV